MLLTLDLSRGMNVVTLPIVTLGTIRPEDSGAARNASALNCTAEPKSSAVWACLGVDLLDMLRTLYCASKGKRSQKPTMPYQPHPHITICTSFISSIDYNVFVVLQCHLKDNLCRKMT